MKKRIMRNEILQISLARKLLMIMKITFVLLLVGLMQVSASTYSQTTKLTLNLKNVKIVDLFEEIETNSEFRFFYESNEIDLLQKVTVDVKESSIKEILNVAFLETGLTYEVIDRHIIVKNIWSNTSEEISEAQQNSITGTVTNIAGEPLPGVTIFIKGSTQGTITNSDGEYTIANVSENTILVFSFIGMLSQEIIVGAQTLINVTMQVDAIGIEEVVAIGYGTMKRSDITGSVTSVKGEDLENTPANTFVQAMQGRAAGVDIKSASNAPGGGIRIRIRGTNSINASSQPLYVIDGFPIDNNDFTPSAGEEGKNALPADPLSSLSPNEIESIEVLKDASATAIYGSRGANGVILITTRRGEVGKSKIDFDHSVNVATVRNRLDLANAEELATLSNVWAENNGRDPIYNGVEKPLPEELGEGTNWQDEIFRTALTRTYNLAISGGTENTRYLVAGNYLDQEGIIINSNFERAGLKFNLDQKVSDRINFGVNMNANRTVNDAVPSEGTGAKNDTPLWSALTTTPVIPVMDENGNYMHNHDEAYKIVENPVAIAKTRSDITNTARIISNAFMDFEIISGLTFRTNFGADLINSKRNLYIPNTAVTQGMPNLGIATVGAVQSLNWLTEYTFTYNKEFGTDHKLTALTGYTQQGTIIEDVYSRTDDFSTNKLEYNNLGAGSDPRPSLSNATEYGLLSYIGRINYGYKNKYILTGTIRKDGSSKFGANNKWGTFPSVGFAWRMSEENFLNNGNVLSSLKLRTSYGLTGNQDIGSYSSLAFYNTTKPIIGGAPVVGFYPNRIPNPELKWEKTTQFNVGLDVAFWNGKYNFTAEYYIKNTDDLLLDVTIPNQSGYGSSVQNMGAVENKGFEFSLGLNNSFGDLKWISNFNISFNKNKLISLTEGTERLIFGLGRGEAARGFSIAIPGEALGSFYGYHFEGIWQTPEEITEAGNIIGGKNRPGLPKYEDLNGDGFRDNDDDRKIIGDPNPDFIYGFSNEFAYKNFTLLIFVNGSYGNEIANLNRISLLTQPQKHNVLKDYYDEYWRGPGTSNTIEAPLHNSGEWKNFSDRDIEDGSYLRVKTISLSYNLPKNLFGANWIRNAQVYVSAENLLTFTNYTGFDPEVDMYSSSNVQMGVDNGAYPVSKSIRIGVKLGF